MNNQTPQINMELFKIILMIGLIITIIVLSIAIYHYGSILTNDPCQLCECPAKFLGISK